MTSIQIENGKAIIATTKQLKSLRHTNSTKVDLTRLPSLNRYCANNPGSIKTIELKRIFK